ncbi:MAG: hypothetical protein OEX12_00265 [Gammaproteobacteria bacterium]|nr:hypothetical protein [Gammaproteobacteria bacterium]
MIRAVLVGGRWLALQIRDVEDDIQNINTFLESSECVLLVEDLEDIPPGFEVEMV